MSQAAKDSLAGASIVTSVTGTANQVTASPTTGNVVVSTPSTFIAPGSIASTTTNTAGTTFQAPAGALATPSYTFTGVTDVGMFRDGNNLGFAVGGSAQAAIFSAGFVSIIPGFFCNSFHFGSGFFTATTTPGAYPYTITNNDYVVLVNSSSARTINLPTTAGFTGQVVFIKDNTGSAGANNITVTPASGTIDGAASYVISANYGSVQLIFDGTNWNILAKG